MKLPVDTYVGTGWDQLLSLMTIMGIIATAVSFAVITWLRLRLRKYFITRPDHEAMLMRIEAEHEVTRGKLASEHRQNVSRLATVEEQLKTLATRHSVAGIEQRQEALNHRVNTLNDSVATLSGRMEGVIASNGRVEHMMGLVLDHMMARDKKE